MAQVLKKWEGEVKKCGQRMGNVSIPQYLCGCAQLLVRTPFFYEPHFHELFFSSISIALISVRFEGEPTFSCAILEGAALWQSPALGRPHHYNPGTWT